MNADDIKRLVIETEEEIFSITGDIEAFLHCKQWDMAMNRISGDHYWEYYPKVEKTEAQNEVQAEAAKFGLSVGMYPIGQKPLRFHVHVERKSIGCDCGNYCFQKSHKHKPDERAFMFGSNRASS